MDILLHSPSAGGVVFRNNEVLLIYSASRTSYAFPKGTIDVGETKDVTALREDSKVTLEKIEKQFAYTLRMMNNDGKLLRKIQKYINKVFKE